ncbi:hypothetical protein HEP73_00849 [Xanthomonas sp. GW]|uniref:hypothetical protein n=1 Tax=Xanthomonas sp. GW TaxID=2724121 RepID=UPI00163A35F9|nr:hypothetical protein [Xanthomonas sp. GW]QNH19951.1 hypothetical protein HEP73_00849 [Xanthomonas sp. GW]
MNAVAAPPSAGSAAAPPPWVRAAVRDVLERSPQYQALAPNDRQALARSMVSVSTLAADLIREEHEAEHQIAGRAPVLAHAQAEEFGAAADRIAGTTRNVLNAVSFPRFVTDLINGVFRAMLDSNAQQMQQYVELLGAVSASAAGFERTQFGLPQVRQWVADHFPEAIEYDTPDPDDEPDPDETAAIRLRLRSGAAMPNAEDVRATLGMAPEEPLDASSPEQLVPLARRYLARQRQQMLATMVAMGMQRIVVDSGRINAAMRFHIDTHSAANEDRGSQFSMQNRVRASGSFGAGPWGASAEIENNIGYVSTQRSQSSEEMNTDLELNSSVELNFRSDYLPLNQMAAPAQAERIRSATLNPGAEIPDPSTARAARVQAQHSAERERRTALDSSIASAARPIPPAPTQTPTPTPTPTPTSGTAARTTTPTAPVATTPATAAAPTPTPAR